MIGTIDDSQRTAARVAGISFLLAITIVVISNYAVSFRFVIPGDVAATVRNIIAHQTAFRLNAAGDLFYLITIIVMLSSLYVILKPVNRNLALVAAFTRLIYGIIWCVIALNILGSLRVLNSASYLSVFNTGQLQALAKLHLVSGGDAYYIGLPFWGLASLICSYLFFKSKYIPRGLAAYGILSSAWCVFCAFTFLVYPHFKEIVDWSWYDLPMTLFEVILGVWLLWKGLRPLTSKV